ncbi:hypothetical protein VTI28DRAFT_8459 [Corynascus sepedonium]
MDYTRWQVLVLKWVGRQRVFTLVLYLPLKVQSEYLMNSRKETKRMNCRDDNRTTWEQEAIWIEFRNPRAGGQRDWQRRLAWPGHPGGECLACCSAARRADRKRQATLGWLSTCLCNGINMPYKYILYSEKTRIILAGGVPQVSRKLIFPCLKRSVLTSIASY